MPDSNPARAAAPGRYRSRFAPSPTGPLHLGSLLAALAGFLQARSSGGEWQLRIDDIDPERSIQSSADSIQRTLERFGLYWDGDVVFQSRRLDRYRDALDQLQQQGVVYGCKCSRKDLASSTPETSVYPGHCRTQGLLTAGAAHAIRLLAADTVIRFRDSLQGAIRHDLAKDTGDFVIRRRDGTFAYHLATVVDDADAEISEVLRGVDLLDSTPRQIHLQDLLQFPRPAYCHVPILVGRDGEKLSKQTFAPSIERDDPAATLCYLLRLLRQDPPAVLWRASVPEVLGWAVAHWKLDRLMQIRSIKIARPEDAAPFSAGCPPMGFGDGPAGA